MIFDDLAGIMNADTARRMSRRTGLSRTKIQRIANGLPINFDYRLIYALQRLGYEIKVEKQAHEKAT